MDAIHIALPPVGTKWKHTNGIIYTVLMITNSYSSVEHYPQTVVYQGGNGRTWSRPVNDWSRSFTPA